MPADDIVPPTEIRDGMLIDWDVENPTSDRLELRADVYWPTDVGRFPVILSYGRYAKGLAFQDAFPRQEEKMVEDVPDVAAGSPNKYPNWEVVDPEKFVPDGCGCMRIDSRWTGNTPGSVGGAHDTHVVRPIIPGPA